MTLSDSADVRRLGQGSVIVKFPSAKRLTGMRAGRGAVLVDVTPGSAAYSIGLRRATT